MAHELREIDFHIYKRAAFDIEGMRTRASSDSDRGRGSTGRQQQEMELRHSPSGVALLSSWTLGTGMISAADPIVFDATVSKMVKG
jgi:hypothetical protein